MPWGPAPRGSRPTMRSLTSSVRARLKTMEHTKTQLYALGQACARRTSAQFGSLRRRKRDGCVSAVSPAEPHQKSAQITQETRSRHSIPTSRTEASATCALTARKSAPSILRFRDDRNQSRTLQARSPTQSFLVACLHPRGSVTEESRSQRSTH